jgi:hypothetical protein
MIRERAMGGEATVVKDKNGNAVMDENGNPQVQVGLITRKDGSVWVPNGTEASITALQKKHNAATNLVQTLDEIRKLGPEWLSDTANSDKSQKLKQLMGDARLQAIAAKDLGVPTGHDIELAENFIGTSDPTRWRDSLAGIMQSRKSIVRDHNAELRTAGLDKDWDPPDLGKKGATAAAGDDQLKDLMRDPAKDDGDTVERWGSEVGMFPFHVTSSTAGLPIAKQSLEYLHEHGLILPSQAAVITTWGDALKSSDAKAREKAASYLVQVTKSGGSPAIKALAQQTLNDATSSNFEGSNTATEEINTPQREVARDTARTPARKSKPAALPRLNSAGNAY